MDEELTTEIGRFDSSGEGSLSSDEFHSFMEYAASQAEDEVPENEPELKTKEYATEGPDIPITKEMSNFLFKGIATESKKVVTTVEIVSFLKLVVEEDFEGLAKIVYRALDPEETGKVAVRDVVVSARIFYIEMLDDEFIERVGREHGKNMTKNEVLETDLTYSQFWIIVKVWISIVSQWKSINLSGVKPWEYVDDGYEYYSGDEEHALVGGEKLRKKKAQGDMKAQGQGERPTAASSCCLLV